MLDPIAEQNARNTALLAEAGLSTAAAVPTDGAPGDYTGIEELFLSAEDEKDRDIPPGLDPDEDKRREEARTDLGIPIEIGNTLHLSADEVEPMQLASFDAAKRRELAKKGLGYALPDGGLPIEDKGNLKAAVGLRNNYKGPHQDKVSAHLKAAASRLDAKDMLPEDIADGGKDDSEENKKGKKLSQGDETHAVSFFDSLTLAEKRGDDGLIWKAICKTGTLALSPGPGQIDVEKPLELTPKLFEELKASVDEQAFPHITVPTTHNNGLLENTGYVRKVLIEPSKDKADPPGTQVFMAGIEFTEPSIKEKVTNGTIPDTSVGVKFNYRNKRTGKLYAAALEHVALTHQPWVDGLTPFGGLSQEGIFDRDEIEPDYDGVYVHASQEPGSNTEGTVEPGKDDPAKGESGDILPEGESTDTVPSVSDKGKDQTVERILASHQAAQESLQQENEKLRRDLALAQGTANSTAEQLHATSVGQRLSQLKDAGFPPSFLTRVESIYLADKPTSESTLQLSLAGAGKDGDALEVGSATELVEFLLAGLPIASNGDVASLVLSLSRESTKRPEEQSTDEKADSIMVDAGLSQEKPKAAKKEGE